MKPLKELLEESNCYFNLYENPGVKASGFFLLIRYKFKQMNTLNTLQNWYKSKCDGNWEHSFGLKIETIDNPGWNITIDLTDTDLEDLPEKQYEFIENSEDDWYGISIKNKIFSGAGDPSKLEFIINEFLMLKTCISDR